MTRIEWHEIMSKNSNPRDRFIHLYNPKKEGLGSYDVHYINAFNKDNNLKIQAKAKESERYVA